MIRKSGNRFSEKIMRKGRMISAGEQLMPFHRFALLRSLVVSALLVVSVDAIAQQPPSPSRVRGTIEGVDGEVLSVKSRSGEDIKLHMTGDLRVVGLAKISLSDIKLGSFIGTTTVPGSDGSQNAVEV